MKKIVLLVAMIVLVSVSMLSLSGCPIYSGSGTMEEKNLEQLIIAMENKDRATIKALFAKNKLAEIENFDEDLEALLEYYEGEYVPRWRGGSGTFHDKIHGVIYKYFEMSYDITTTVRIYRIALTWYVKDTGDEGNVGIWQMFILKMEDSPTPERSYWGDGSNEPGIFIGKILG